MRMLHNPQSVERFKRKVAVMKLGRFNFGDYAWALVGAGAAVTVVLFWCYFDSEGGCHKRTDLDSLFAGLAFAGLLATILFQDRQAREIRRQTAHQLLTSSLSEYVGFLHKISEKVNKKFDYQNAIWQQFACAVNHAKWVPRAEIDGMVNGRGYRVFAGNNDIRGFLRRLTPWVNVFNMWEAKVDASDLTESEKITYKRELVGICSDEERLALMLARMQDGRISHRDNSVLADLYSILKNVKGDSGEMTLREHVYIACEWFMISESLIIHNWEGLPLDEKYAFLGRVKEFAQHALAEYRVAHRK